MITFPIKPSTTPLYSMKWDDGPTVTKTLSRVVVNTHIPYNTGRSIEEIRLEAMDRLAHELVKELLKGNYMDINVDKDITTERLIITAGLDVLK